MSGSLDCNLFIGVACGGGNHYLCIRERVLKESRKPRQQSEEGARCAEVSNNHRTNDVGRDKEFIKKGTLIGRLFYHQGGLGLAIMALSTRRRIFGETA